MTRFHHIWSRQSHCESGRGQQRLPEPPLPPSPLPLFWLNSSRMERPSMSVLLRLSRASVASFTVSNSTKANLRRRFRFRCCFFGAGGGGDAHEDSPLRSPVSLRNPDGSGLLKGGLEDVLRGAEGQVVDDQRFAGWTRRCWKEQVSDEQNRYRLPQPNTTGPVSLPDTLAPFWLFSPTKSIMMDRPWTSAPWASSSIFSASASVLNSM